MITLKNLEKQIKNQKNLYVKNLTFEKGKIYSVLGHNGSGKSTLIKVLYNIEDFQKGEITINNNNISQKKIYKNISYNPQESRFLTGTLRDNFNYIYKYSKNENILDKETLNKLIKEFDLEFKQDTNIKKLSGGEKAKAQFIRTIIMNKDYNLLDEPMANMDFETIKKVEEKLLQLKKEGKTIILVTHDFMQAKRLSDYIVFMENLEYKGTYSCNDFFDKVFN